jgi:hypothetical protein
MSDRALDQLASGLQRAMAASPYRCGAVVWWDVVMPVLRAIGDRARRDALAHRLQRHVPACTAPACGCRPPDVPPLAALGPAPRRRRRRRPAAPGAAAARGAETGRVVRRPSMRYTQVPLGRGGGDG